MPEINPLAVIAECIEKAKATTDQELINDYIAESPWGLADRQHRR
jgi:hypothetical protein